MIVRYTGGRLDMLLYMYVREYLYIYTSSVAVLCKGRTCTMGDIRQFIHVLLGELP